MRCSRTAQSLYAGGCDLIASNGKKQGFLVYSVIILDMFNFDILVKNHLGCETCIFDPAVTNFHQGEYATFHKWGLRVNEIFLI